MAERSALSRGIVMAICLGVTALGLANTYGDNADVVKLAQARACGSEGCSFQTLRQERSPFSQSFTFQVSLTEKGKQRGATADVKCARAYVLLGDYACELTSGGLQEN
ncbi:MAG TPA: hypothetical protein VGK73_24455 [Polyangiaceae bacterium]